MRSGFLFIFVGFHGIGRIMDGRMRENVRIEEIGYDRETCLPLLLMGDEQEDMIDRYIGRSRLYAMYERDRMVCLCAVTDEGGGLCEIKNLATAPGFRRRGYGKAMIGFVERHYSRSHRVLQVGTGESPATMGFYERCGFVFSHRLPDFFTENYTVPIVEEGVRLEDMVYLKKEL